LRGPVDRELDQETLQTTTTTSSVSVLLFALWMSGKSSDGAIRELYTACPLGSVTLSPPVDHENRLLARLPPAILGGAWILDRCLEKASL